MLDGCAIENAKNLTEQIELFASALPFVAPSMLSFDHHRETPLVPTDFSSEHEP